MNLFKSFDSNLGQYMHKAARPSGGMESSNPCRWRGKRLHHHGGGGGVCWLFVFLWIDLWHHELIVCKKWYENNLKMRLTTLLFDPPRRAPHPYSLSCNSSQDKIITWVATKDLVSEISHDLIIVLSLVLLPGTDHDLRTCSAAPHL